MNKKILSTVIAAAMLLSMTALSGCETKAADTASVNSNDSGTEAVIFELGSDSESGDSSSDEEKASSEKSVDSISDKDDTNSNMKASSKAASSKAASSNSTSSKSESSKESSDGLTDDEALEIVLNNTDFTKDELESIAVNEENGEKFHNVSFFRNGTYVFYVRDRDKKFFTYEDTSFQVQ